MGLVNNIWRTITHTKALDQSSGQLETVFFESVYRVTYITGKGAADLAKVICLFIDRNPLRD